MTPVSWWADPELRDNREAFYQRADLEGERMHRTEKRASGYVLPIGGEKSDYWKKPQAGAYHDETV